MIPWFDRPVIYDVRAQPHLVDSISGSCDLQMVDSFLDFLHIREILDDVSITSLTFGREFTAAIEAKQVAAQEAERAKFVVEKAEQDKRSAVIRAQDMEQDPIDIVKIHCQIFSRLDMLEISPPFMLKRWTKNANKDAIVDEVGSLIHDEHFGAKALRISHIDRRVTGLASMVGRSEAMYTRAMYYLDRSFEEIETMEMRCSRKKIEKM
ncbi:hypothetical protein HHK36_023596 [Tetracentron sinense]|uniref:Prohibitin n=1 Tax=Tetracentron sinense TaxID=13715 RepID=A0A835D8U3_TETSI|nr:hypothetical protein HHK36_023596 [Tetracentron sinense]